jgi:multidrug efflux system outer membrane protein
MGRRPQAGVPELGEAAALPAARERVPVGLPSELLRRRPDVLAAERRLAAATADVGVAAADRFPRFFLTGSPYLQAESFADLFSSASTGWLFGPSLSWSLFSGGRTEALVEASEAWRAQALLEYEAVVSAVLEEAEGSLVRFGKDAEALRLLSAAAETAGRGARLRELRHERGIDERLAVLDARALWLDARRRSLDQEVLLLTRLVALHKALGGGWAAAEAAAIAAAETPAAQLDGAEPAAAPQRGS